MQKTDYLGEGLSEDEAERRAVEDMGDALMVGGELDRVHRPQTQWTGILAALAFLMLGLYLGTVFTASGLTEEISAKQAAGVCAAAGIILLMGLTDYTRWVRLAIPAAAAWGVLLLLKVLNGPNVMSYYLGGSPEIAALYRITEDHIALAAPLLLSLMIADRRGGGWGAFCACLSLPMGSLLLGCAYSWRGYTAYVPLFLTLLELGILTYAVRKGFFRIPRRSIYIALGGVALAIVAGMLLNPDGYVLERNYMKDFVYPLVRNARAWGADARDIDLLGSATELYDGDWLLPFVIYRFGWIPFGLGAAAVVGLLGWSAWRFQRMENRMGGMLGFSATAVLSLQLALYLIHSFTTFNFPIGLPLVTYGTVVLWIDAVLVGIILSCLRGQKLPEAEIRFKSVGNGVEE